MQSHLCTSHAERHRLHPTEDEPRVKRGESRPLGILHKRNPFANLLVLDTHDPSHRVRVPAQVPEEQHEVKEDGNIVRYNVNIFMKTTIMMRVTRRNK